MRLTSELVDWLDERRHLPPVKVSLTSKDSPRTVDAAQEMRTMLGIPNVTPIEYLTHPAERAGIVVVVRRRALSDGWAGEWESHHEERHEGCSAWIGEFRERPLIVMRSVPTWEKTRWVLAHELGHLYLHAGRTLVSEAAEEQASRFASELLAPIDQLVLELPRVVTLTALLKLKFKWGISLAALIRHLHGNDVISDQRRKTLYDQLYTRRNPETGRSFGVTEPGWDQRLPERPRLIAAWSKHITGSLVPEAIASASRIFPPDLLMSILNEQRGAPRRSAPPPPGGSVGKVIPLKERQAEKNSEMKRFRA